MSFKYDWFCIWHQKLTGWKEFDGEKVMLMGYICDMRMLRKVVNEDMLMGWIMDDD